MPAPPNTPAEQLASELDWTYDNLIRIAQAYLDDPAHGDIDRRLVYCFVTGSRHLRHEQVDQLVAELDAMRRRHFAALGLPLPPQSTEPLR